MARGLAAVASIAALSGGCSVASDVDVCERELPAIVDVNSTTDGDQELRGPRALVPLPDQHAMVGFVSKASASSADEVVRLMRLDASGVGIGTCDGSGETTWWPPDGVPSEQDGAAIGGLALAPPATLTGPGVIAWSTAPTESGRAAIYVSAFEASGCAHSDLRRRSAISDEPVGWVLPAAPTVVPIGDPARTTFVVLWASFAADPTEPGAALRARAFQILRTTAPLFVELHDARTGTASLEPVDVPATAGRPNLVSAVSLGADRIAIASHTTAPAGFQPELAIVDSTMRVVVAPFPLDEPAPTSAAGARVDLAFDGRQLLVVWTRVGDDGRRRSFGRFATPGGDFLSTPTAPDGGPFALSTDDEGETGDVVAVARPEGGFFVAYTRIVAGGAGASATTTTALVGFDADGERQFLGPACDRAAVALSTPRPGAHFGPGLTVLGDGTVGVVWTARGSNGRDASGTGILSRFFARRALLPVP